jgi:hypothetical protein
VCQNYQKPGHYARDFPLPPVTCMYCCATYDDIEDCPIVLGRNQVKRNHNSQNVKWIYAEARDDVKNIDIFNRGGSKIGTDVAKQDPTQYQWVKKNTEPQKKFDAQKKRKYLRRQEKSFSRRTLNLHQLHKKRMTHQCTICHCQWITPVKNNR